MQTHDLKILPEYYSRVATGQKTFEIRRNDRDFQTGDKLYLREWSVEEGNYTERAPLVMSVQYTSTFNQEDGWIVLGIAPFQPEGEIPY